MNLNKPFLGANSTGNFIMVIKLIEEKIYLRNSMFMPDY